PPGCLPRLVDARPVGNPDVIRFLATVRSEKEAEAIGRLERTAFRGIRLVDRAHGLRLCPAGEVRPTVRPAMRPGGSRYHQTYDQHSRAGRSRFTPHCCSPSNRTLLASSDWARARP